MLPAAHPVWFELAKQQVGNPRYRGEHAWAADVQMSRLLLFSGASRQAITQHEVRHTGMTRRESRHCNMRRDCRSSAAVDFDSQVG